MADEPVDASRQRERYDISKSFSFLEIQTLRELLGLTAEYNQDSVIFIAIDFGGINNITPDLTRNGNSEVGLALLDTQDLSSFSVPTSQLISTYNFASGSRVHQMRARERFLFGKSVRITQEGMLSCIESLIPRGRPMVLVGHDIKHDLRVLKRLSFNFGLYDLTILDTQFGRQRSLKRVLRKFGCPAMELHCSGNDANFTLREMLLIAMHGVTEQPDTRERMGRVRDVAFSPPPISVQLRQVVDTSAIERHPYTWHVWKKARRVEKRMKLLEKLWGLEKVPGTKIEMEDSSCDAE